MFTVDIETAPIQEGHPTLPKPVGVAIKPMGGEAEYLAFGHPTGNNCTWDEARARLCEIWDAEWITHNGSTFDVPVLTNWFDLPERKPRQTQDTLLLAFLHSPHAPSLGLKPLAHRWLGMPADEREELTDWIIQHTDCRSRKKAGAHICEAPGDLVGRYAIGDVVRTEALFEYLSPLVLPQMLGAYDRERRLAPVLVEMQCRGIRCDTDRLEADLLAATRRLHAADADVRVALSVPELNLDSNGDLVEALERRGFTGFLTTETGARSASKLSLDKVLADSPALREALLVRGHLATLTGTFMGPWLDIARSTGGTIHATYNQTRNPEGFGTRTGRLSSSHPNFQNVPNDLGHQLPLMKSYLLPDPGDVWVSIDAKSQEPRLAAHFEDGALLAAYKGNASLDPYQFVMERVGGGITRKQAKAVFLGLLYGMGVARLADQLDIDSVEAGMLRSAVRLALPDIVGLDAACKRRFQQGAGVTTLGGRTYFCEAPSNGRTWEYKALNTLIQGSAADQTKQALVYIAEHLPEGSRILGTVHDEINISAPREDVDEIIHIAKLAFNSLPCDCPSEITVGVGNTWAEAAGK